jgi:hypothetical protein
VISKDHWCRGQGAALADPPHAAWGLCREINRVS